MAIDTKLESAVTVDEMFDKPGFTSRDKEDMLHVGKKPRLNVSGGLCKQIRR